MIDNLRKLVERCRSGAFYDDYDQDTALVAAAHAELDALEPLVAAALKAVEPDPDEQYLDENLPSWRPQP